MSKYLSIEQWKPSEGFISTEITDSIIKEREKNLSILAGPGAGKTEILAQRANFLLQTGVCKSPQKILALSFKVDAASNIKKRVDLRCSREAARRFSSSTFDAFNNSLVRRFLYLSPEWIKISNDFEVYPFDKDWWAEFEQSELDGRPYLYKGSYFPLDLSENPEAEIERIWEYCARKKVVDYNMCRSMAYTIVKNNSQVKNLISSTYKYLFLDEFQDTTNPQYEFLKIIFDNSDTKITAVGDTNQMIMGWAGANSKNFNKLKSDFDSELVPLAINHRSNHRIIKLINHVIKDLTPEGEEPVVYEGTSASVPPPMCLGVRSFDNAQSEAEYISKSIQKIMNENSQLLPSNFALVLRQKAQDYFNKANDIFEANNFSLRNEDAFVVKNGIKLQDLMSEPLNIFLVLLIRKKTGFIDYNQEKELEGFASTFKGLDLGVERERLKVKKFVFKLLNLLDLSEPITISMIKIIGAIGKPRVKTVYPQYSSKHLLKVMRSFSVLMQDALDKNPTNVKLAIENYEGVNQVKLMTIHKSKSLEFDTVFFVDFHHDSWWGLCKAVEQNNKEKQQEEKNSFFVGLSRAEERLYFTKNKGNWPPVITDLLGSSRLLHKMPDL